MPSPKPDPTHVTREARQRALVHRAEAKVESEQSGQPLCECGCGKRPVDWDFRIANFKLMMAEMYGTKPQWRS